VVLLVEDDEQNRELATFLLEEAGFQVRSAQSAAEALEQLARAKPDVVLLDMSLRGQDGLRLVARLREVMAGEPVPIVALTAHAMRGDRERFLAGGCDSYIAKPFAVKAFVSEVEAVHARRPRGEGA
jgi:CheY-like chemotaxis protein